MLNEQICSILAEKIRLAPGPIIAGVADAHHLPIALLFERTLYALEIVFVL